MTIAFSILTALIGFITTIVQLIYKKEKEGKALAILAACAFLLAAGSAIWAARDETRKAEMAHAKNDDLTAQLNAISLKQVETKEALDKATSQLSEADMKINGLTAQSNELTKHSNELNARVEELDAEAKKFRDARDALRKKVEDLLNNSIVQAVAPVKGLLNDLSEQLATLGDKQ